MAGAVASLRMVGRRGSRVKRTLAARVVDRRTEYEGFLSVRRYEIEETLHGGGQQRVVRSIMEGGQSVAVLPYDPVRDRVVLISELRPGIRGGGPAFSDALVAGAVEEGEDVLSAAVREASEEAGLALRSPRVIHQRAFVSPGGTSESIAVVYGVVDAGDQRSPRQRQRGREHSNGHPEPPHVDEPRP